MRRWIRWICALAWLAAGFWLWQWQSWSRREHSQDQVIAQAALRYRMDPALIKAVVWRESRFDPWARGRAGEIGLMQLRDTAAREWAASEKSARYTPASLFDPRQNTLAGTWYLKKLLARYQTTDLPAVYALADYNAGRRNVLRWIRGAATTNHIEFLRQLDFAATRQYVQSVLHRAKRYQRDFPNSSLAAGNG